MKKLLIALIPSLIVLCFILTLTPTKASTDELLFKIRGWVRYSTTGNGVGAGRLVYVYDSPSHSIGYDETDQTSYYGYSFHAPLYVYKVRCAFWQSDTHWIGETIIDQTLYTDYTANITVYPYLAGQEPDGIGN
ncbi:MAG: hypothetical protein ABIL20_05055 [candidate division WOR-3 bacterium]